MPNSYFAQWWRWMARGVLAILFGLLAFVLPGLTLALLVLLFGIWALVDGVTHVSAALCRRMPHRSLHAMEGAIGIAAGLIALFYPMATVLGLVYVIAVWAVLTGATRIALAIQLHDTPSREWLIGLTGVLALLFGLILAWVPAAGAVAMAVWVGIYAILAGLIFVGLSLRMRRMHRLLRDGL